MRDYRFREILETINYACYMVYDDDITGLREKMLEYATQIYIAQMNKEKGNINEKH